MFRFGFNIRTRSGQRVDNISIMAQSQADAERRLRQMYPQCEIQTCQTSASARRGETQMLAQTLDMESVIGMICAQPLRETVRPGWSGLRNKSGLS